MKKAVMSKVIKVELSCRELIDVCNVFAELDISTRNFLEIKDKRIRTCFEQAWHRRHKLWLRLTHLTEAAFNGKN